MNDTIFVEVDDAIDDLSRVVTNHVLRKRAKVVQHLIEASSGHPLDEDVDVPFVLSGAETADNVGVGESAQHHHLLLQPLQLLLLLSLSVSRVTHLRDGVLAEECRQTGYG